MSDTIKNTATLLYAYGGSSFSLTDSCEIEKNDPVLPILTFAKTCKQTSSSVGDTHDYILTVASVGGDVPYTGAIVRDTPDETMEFVGGSISVDGVIQPEATLSGITFDIDPDTTIEITYQCVRISY